MSTAKLNVWITAVGDPCRIDSRNQWFVHILHCDGRALEWCDKVYVNIPAKCGQAEIDIPPGCYMVCATWSPAPVTSGQQVITTLGNHISHMSIVRADCAKEYCVTLFPPTFHWCSIWWLVAAREQVARRGLEAAPAERAIAAVDELMKTLKLDPITENMLPLTKGPGRPDKKK